MYGQEEDGESKLCAPLFQIQEEEEDKTEEKENEDPEDGYREKKEKNTPHHTPRRPFSRLDRVSFILARYCHILYRL